MTTTDVRAPKAQQIIRCFEEAKSSRGEISWWMESKNLQVSKRCSTSSCQTIPEDPFLVLRHSFLRTISSNFLRFESQELYTFFLAPITKLKDFSTAHPSRLHRVHHRKFRVPRLIGPKSESGFLRSFHLRSLPLLPGLHQAVPIPTRRCSSREVVRAALIAVRKMISKVHGLWSYLRLARRPTKSRGSF